jgi:uncharacterized protein with HEPN domain
MSKDWRLYAQYIIDTAKQLERIQMRGDIRTDTVLYDAALRNLQTLAESRQHLPNEFKTEHSTIPWRKIYDFRNILVHDYLGDIDVETVLNILNEYLPPLTQTVSRLLSSQGNAS